MSPVQQSRVRSPRTLILAFGGLLVGIVLVLTLFLFAIPTLTESGKIEVRLGTETFPLGNARVKARSIAETGPFLFPDPGNGQRDIYVQHMGGDPLMGWTAFDARKPGTGRECSLRWDNTAKHFTEPCDRTTVPADGAGLPHYRVDVGADEQLAVDLRGDRGTTTTTTAAPAPSSSILVTGSTAR